MVKLTPNCARSYISDLARCFKNAKLAISAQLNLGPEFTQNELEKMTKMDIDAHTDIFWVSCEGKSHQVNSYYISITKPILNYRSTLNH